MQQTGPPAGPRPWLLVKPMTGTTIFQNELYVKVHLDAEKCSKLASRLFNLYMQKTEFYIKKYHWWHHDTNMDNAFWDADLTSVNCIDWGNAKKVVSCCRQSLSALKIITYGLQPFSRLIYITMQSGAKQSSRN